MRHQETVELPATKKPATLAVAAATGVRRAIYLIAGCFFVGLGTLGALLPVLPTTPFLLLASYFLVRSSPRLSRWMVRSPLLGPFLHDWQRYRGVRPHVKLTAATVVVAGVSASAIFGNLPGWLLAILLVAGGIGLFVVLRLPVIRAVAAHSHASAHCGTDD